MQLMTRSDFATLAGVSPAAITKALGKKLAPAANGKRIDAAHPVAVEYLEQKEQARNAPPPEPKEDPPEKKQRTKRGEQPTAEPRQNRQRRTPRGAEAKKAEQKKHLSNFDISSLPADLSEWIDEPLRKILDVFGTDTALKDFVDSVGKMETATEKRLKNEEKKGNLVSRDLMKKLWFDPVEEFHQKLLADAPGRIARGVESAVKAGDNQSEIESFIRNEISVFLKQLKRKLKNLK